MRPVELAKLEFSRFVYRKLRGVESWVIALKCVYYTGNEKHKRGFNHVNEKPKQIAVCKIFQMNGIVNVFNGIRST